MLYYKISIQVQIYKKKFVKLPKTSKILKKITIYKESREILRKTYESILGYIGFFI